MNCPRCGAPLVKRSRSRLFIAGLLFFAGALAIFMFLHLLPAILASVFLAVVGVYFLTSAVQGKLQWCRNCRRFPAGGA